MFRVQPPRAAQAIEVVTSDWEPYVDPSSDNGGAVSEIVTAVLNRSGYKSEVTFGSWENGLARVEQGNAFGIFPMVRSSAREDDFEYSSPLFSFKYVLFAKRVQPIDESVLRGDLTGRRVGLLEGYDYWPELDSSGATFVRYASTMEGFEALESGEVDFLAESELVGNATLTSGEFEHDAGDFTVVGGDNPALSSEEEVYFLIHKSPNSPQLMARFNEALEEFKSTERYKQLIEGVQENPEQVLVGKGSKPAEIRDAEGSLIGSVPSGTRAIVLEWPSELTESSWVKVKILNDPLDGRIGFVTLESLEIVNV